MNCVSNPAYPSVQTPHLLNECHSEFFDHRRKVPKNAKSSPIKMKKLLVHSRGLLICYFFCAFVNCVSNPAYPSVRTSLKAKNFSIKMKKLLVHSRGFEPLTLGAEIRYSIQLNYECNFRGKITQKSLLKTEGF